jgi:hypothetical protein
MASRNRTIETHARACLTFMIFVLSSVAAVHSAPVFGEIFGTEDRTTGPSPVLRGAAGPDR